MLNNVFNSTLYVTCLHVDLVHTFSVNCLWHKSPRVTTYSSKLIIRKFLDTNLEVLAIVLVDDGEEDGHEDVETDEDVGDEEDHVPGIPVIGWHPGRGEEEREIKGEASQAFTQIGWMEDDIKNLTAKVWAKLDNPIKRYDFPKVSLILCMSLSQVALF